MCSNDDPFSGREGRVLVNRRASDRPQVHDANAALLQIVADDVEHGSAFCDAVEGISAEPGAKGHNILGRQTTLARLQ